MFPRFSRFKNGIAYHSRTIPILKCGSPGSDIVILNDAVQQVCNLMNKEMFPSDDMTVRPPVFPPGVIGFGNKYIMESLGLLGFFFNPKDLQLIHPLQVEKDGSFLSVNLQNLMILPASGIAAGFQSTDGAVLEFHCRDKGVIHIDFSGTAAFGQRNVRYSAFMNGLFKADVQLNRKMLSEIAVADPATFDRLVEIASAAA